MNTLLAVKQNAGADIADRRAELVAHVREAARIAHEIAITEVVQMFITEADGAEKPDAEPKGADR